MASTLIPNAGSTTYNNMWIPYTPVWTSSGTAPAIGNSTVTGAYQQFGKTVLGRISIVFGSTATYGTGNYYLSLPVTARFGGLDGLLSTGYVYDASASTFYNIRCDNNDGTTKLTMRTMVADGTFTRLGTVAQTAPMTFAQSDEIKLTFIYEAL